MRVRSLSLLLAAMPFFAAPPPIPEQRLPGGLRVRLAENHERPLLELRLELHWPSSLEGAGKEGIATLLARMLQGAGAGPYGPSAFRKALEDRGLDLEVRAGTGRFTWILRGPSSIQEEAFECLAHAVARPRLDGSLLEAQRTERAAELRSLSLETWAEERFRATLEGRPRACLGEGALARLSLEDVEAFRKQVLHPSRAVLAVHGDLSPAQARQLAQLHLGIWGGGDPPPVPTPPEVLPVTVATPAGAPALRMALPWPATLPREAASLLEPWLRRQLSRLPAGSRMGSLSDGRPCLELHATLDPTGTPMDRAARFGAALDALAADGPTPEEALILDRLASSAREALPLHPSGQLAQLAEDPAPSAALPPLADLLRAWLSPASRRCFLTGAPASGGPCGLEALGPVSWVKTKE